MDNINWRFTNLFVFYQIKSLKTDATFIQTNNSILPEFQEKEGVTNS